MTLAVAALSARQVAVTVPGDNSVDIYIHDIGLVVILNDDGTAPALFIYIYSIYYIM